MTKKISLASIMTAVSIVFLFGSAYAPTGKAAFLVLTSMCMIVTVSECGIKYGWLQYIAVAVMSLLLLPSKGQMFLFVFIIGYYPILKLHIENIKNIKLEWLIKIIYFNFTLAVMFFILKYVIFNFIYIGNLLDMVMSNFIFAIVIAEIVFILYDFFLSFFIRYYRNVIRKRLKF